jgi:uncharacterized BrkB/YihY/UPF0761 family membrane protein
MFDLFSKQFVKDLKPEISNQSVHNGAAVLAFYLMLPVLPAAIFMPSLLLCLPIPNLEQSILNLIGPVLPQETARPFTGILNEDSAQRHSGYFRPAIPLMFRFEWPLAQFRIGNSK